MEDSEKKYTDMLRTMVLDAFRDENCQIFIFGSRARGDFRRSSDFDVGFKGISRQKMLKKISDLETKIEESIIPHSVDWVLFDETDESFRNIAEKDILVWKA